MGQDIASLDEQFQWRPEPQAARFVSDLVRDFRADLDFVNRLANRLLRETGTRLADWVDHFVLPRSSKNVDCLQTSGYTDSPGGVWRHHRGLFPVIRLTDAPDRHIALKVDSIVDFLIAQELASGVVIQGGPLAAVRACQVAHENHAVCKVIERHGADGFEPQDLSPRVVPAVLQYTETFRLRPRRFDSPATGFEQAGILFRSAASEIGVPRATDLFFAAERQYWQSRNRAARAQKARQDALGMGWANHDHHTYRSSREHFVRLIGFFEEIGFACRERFYAGREAGWGAQVLEHPICPVVIFADVDLSPDEVAGDFAHEPLAPRNCLGTVGLWCRLHGEAFLEAGMHHLECQFDFDAAREQLAGIGIETMKPFTDLPYLRQAFTKGDTWPVDPEKIASLRAAGLISAEQAEQFRSHGALGSHLEILQRDDGYKGFNQAGIDEIIRATDPRHLADGA